MKIKTIIIGGFIGFAVGVCSMMMVNTPPGKLCYDIIEEIGFEVCEECWHDVFDSGNEYQEVEDYVTWE